MKTLYVKELRENAKWIILGLLVMLLLTWAHAPKYVNYYFGNFKPSIGFAAGLFALFLGIMQSAADFSNRQQGFLLHRSVSRNQILFSKILAGITIYTIVIGIPLLIIVFYFAAMGLEYLPVRPLQIVEPALLICLCYFVHPSAIFTMTRPARWFGTKALPLVIPIASCYFFCTAHDNRWQSWGMFAMLGCSLTILSLGTFFHSLERLAIVCNSLTMVAIAMSVIGYCTLGNEADSEIIGVYEVQGIDSNGDIWDYQFRNNYDKSTRKYQREILSASRLAADGIVEASSPNDLEITSLHMLTPVTTVGKDYGKIELAGAAGDRGICWDERGYFLLYDEGLQDGLLGTITRDGFNEGTDPRGRRFASNPLITAEALSSVGTSMNKSGALYSYLLIADQNGVYVLDKLTGDVQTVIADNIEAVASVLYGDGYSKGFIVQTAKELQHYQLQSRKPGQDDAEDSLAQISFEKIATYANLPREPDLYWAIGMAPNGKLAALANAPMLDRVLTAYPETQRPSLAYEWFHFSSNRRLASLASELPGKYLVATLLSPSQSEWSVESVDFKPQSNSLTRYSFTLSSILGFVPLIQTAILAMFIVASAVSDYGASPILHLWAAPEGQHLVAVYLTSLIATTLLATASTLLLLRKRSTDIKLTLLWIALVIPCGLAVPIAVAAIYPKLIYEQCPKCNRKRRVDCNKCEHCGANWEALPSQGIEIVEGQALENIPAPSSTS